MTNSMTSETPIQPVARPILNNPYEEPTKFWQFDRTNGESQVEAGRRPAKYWFKTRERQRGQLSLDLDEGQEDLPTINALRDDVRRWRQSGWQGATPVTRELLRHWSGAGRDRRLFFCQLEAAETIIYLREILRSGRTPRFTPKFKPPELEKLVDRPADPDAAALIRYGCKMATGSGKTVVMSMLISWAFVNRGRNPTDQRFPAGVLVCCPNLTVKDRLGVLRPDAVDNYYEQFDMVPSHLRPLLQRGRVKITNWHAFAPEASDSARNEGGGKSAVIDKGEETDDAFARRVLGDLYDRRPLLVLNDEAHHAYRPKTQEPTGPDGRRLKGEARKAAMADNAEATVWISGLDRINNSAGVQNTPGIDACVDLSATPFYIAGSGYAEGSPLPWLVSDFGLVDAIESGIVKIPRLPVAETSGRPDPKYFKLWRRCMDDLSAGQKLPGGKPKPDALYAQAEGALQQLAGQWLQKFELFEEAKPGQETVPPVMIVCCDNTDIAEYVHRKISGESVEKELTPDDVREELADETETKKARRKKKAQTKDRVVYGESSIMPELANSPQHPRRTIRIDSKLLAEAESDQPGKKKAQAAEELRQIVATVGKMGQPGQSVRCVVSVSMLTEGWDANSVTHILGLRAFGSQLLCEQVVGRGLRRMDYVPDPKTGLLTEEYVDVYGIPFSVIPFRGRESDSPETDRPKNHVRARLERSGYEIRFPVVENYAFDLKQNLIRCDVASMPPLQIEPNREPTATFVRVQVGYQEGDPGQGGPFAFEEQNRAHFYAENHLQTIQFNVARLIVAELTGGETVLAESGRRRSVRRLQSRHQLFPQVYRFVDQYVRTRVDFRGANPSELGLEHYVRQMVERFAGHGGAIVPDDAAGEPPLMPILNPYQPFASTAGVDFKTTRPCHGTVHSHVDQVVLDAPRWEAATAFRLEQAAVASQIRCYVRNDHLGLVIPYEYLDQPHGYEPDWIVQINPGHHVILETKGYEDNQTRAKYAAAGRWVRAVNNWGQMGHWQFEVNRDPQVLLDELARWIGQPGGADHAQQAIA